jgi:glyoxylase-like metal-dependent hydrolase (beta-lactamase superfamily II)
MLDAGSSAAHARAFLGDLLVQSGTRPSAVVYTHSHWDHVFGGAEIGGLVIAHAHTAERLIEAADTDWSDEALDRRVAAGLASPQHAAHVKEELPSPPIVEVALADVVFHDEIEIDLGSVSVHVRHVGGDHSADSSVMYVEPDGVLFLGDCMYASPDGVLTPESAFRLRDTILGFAAEHYVEGHHESVSSRTDMEELLEKMRLAEAAVREGSEITAPDEDTEYFIHGAREATPLMHACLCTRQQMICAKCRCAHESPRPSPESDATAVADGRGLARDNRRGRCLRPGV